MKQTKTELIVKVTRDCNLRCKYCYIPFTTGRTVMSEETVENIIGKFSSRFQELKFIWHGGEPLLAGINFYRMVLRSQNNHRRTHGTKFVNGLQTNSVLLNDEYLRFFLDNNFSVGVSSDGPAQIQDLTRPLFSGKGSFRLVDEQIKKIAQTKISTGGICVVSKVTADKAEEIYNYYKSRGLVSMTLLPYMGKDPALQLSNQEYFTFHREMYDAWVQDSVPLKRLAPLTTIVKRMLGGESAAYANELPICDYAGICFYNFFTIDTNGDFLPCCAIDQPVLGNVNTNSLEEILVSRELKKLQETEDKVKEECQSSCEYFFVCNSGCRGASHLTNGDLTVKDFYCDGKRELFSYIQNDLERRLKCMSVLAQQT